MTASTVPTFNMLARSAPEVDAAVQLRAALHHLFVRRTRIALATIFGGMLLFSMLDQLTGAPGSIRLLELRAVCAGLIVLGYALVGRPRLLHVAPALAWIVFASGCGLAAFAGTLSHVASGASPILCVLFAFAAGALFPWGSRVQVMAAVAAAAALTYNLHWVHTAAHPIITYQGAEGVAVCLIVSVICAAQARARVLALMCDNIQRRHAEEALRASNQHLERRVRLRVAELEKAKRDLAQQIAENRAVSKTLEDSEHLLRAIIDNSGALIYVKDLDGRYTLANEQHARLFGYPRNDIVGKTPYDLFPPATAAAMLANDQQILATDRPFQFEETLPHDGEVRAFLSTKFAVRDPSGVTYGICGISTDITERERMESALRRSQATLSTLIDHSDEGIWALDPDYRIRMLNTVSRQRFFQAYGTHPEVGTDFRNLLPPDIRAHWTARVDQALAGHRMIEEIALPDHGETRHFLVSLNPIVEASGVMGVTIFVRDISPLKRAEERLRQHQADLAQVLRRNTMGEFAAELAHEINQPLGAIANYAQGCFRRIQSDDFDRAELRDAIDQIIAETRRANGVLDRLHTSVLPAPVRSQPIDVNQLIHAAVRAVEFRCGGLRLRISSGERVPLGQGDLIQIEQVVLNLLHNAIDALEDVSPEARELVMETRLADGAIEVTIRDSGPGLDPTIATKVFQPFMTTKSQGLGMGLVICRSIIEAHGGRLWVTSERGRGCAFHFTLAASAAAPTG